MAKYIYKCFECKNRVEKEIPMKEYNPNKTHKCTKCGKKLTRVIEYASPVVYNGNGFYSTDNKKDKDED